MIFFKIAIIIAIVAISANGIRSIADTYKLGKGLDSVDNSFFWALSVHWEDFVISTIVVLILAGGYTIL